jgi:hypothetical protein
MIHRQATSCIDPTHEVNAPGNDLRTRCVLGAIQTGLAIVFVPGAVLILILVGLYMIGEWTVLQVGRLISYLGRHSTANPYHPIRGFRRMTMIR